MNMEIVCATDRCYVMQTCIMLTSLFENNRGERIRVHLLHDDIGSENLSKVEHAVSVYAQQVLFYSMDDELFHELPIERDGQNSHVGTSYATYYRLFLTKILPSDITRVIYLDGDLIVMDSLKELWNFDMHDKAIAAVPDSYTDTVTHYNRLHYPMYKGYFNAGVLLINLDYWREHNLLESFIEYGSANNGILVCHDQDILNYLLQDNKIVLPLRYNMLNEYWFELRYSIVAWTYNEQIKFGQQHPAIIHFTGIPKPWYINCQHPLKKEYERYRKLTVWNSCSESRWMPLKYILEQVAIKFIVAIGLRKSDYIIKNRFVKL